MKKLNIANSILSVWFMVMGILVAAGIMKITTIGSGIIIGLLGLNLLIKEVHISNLTR